MLRARSSRIAKLPATPSQPALLGLAFGAKPHSHAAAAGACVSRWAASLGCTVGLLTVAFCILAANSIVDFGPALYERHAVSNRSVDDAPALGWLDQGYAETTVKGAPDSGGGSSAVTPAGADSMASEPILEGYDHGDGYNNENGRDANSGGGGGVARAIRVRIERASPWNPYDLSRMLSAIGLGIVCLLCVCAGLGCACWRQCRARQLRRRASKLGARSDNHKDGSASDSSDRMLFSDEFEAGVWSDDLRNLCRCGRARHGQHIASAV
jgi:hypothetical protein